MQIHITARHLDLTPALADYVQKKLQRVARHFQSVVRAQVVLDVEKHRHMAEVVIHANGHHEFRAKSESADLYSAVDIVSEKLHNHMARQKDKVVLGRRRRAPRPWEVVQPDGRQTVADSSADEPAVTRIRRFTPRALSLPQAISEMERNNFDFLVFSNDGELNIVYKRQDKTYGLLEPEI
jgi:putative sigma-54 modulation protein